MKKPKEKETTPTAEATEADREWEIKRKHYETLDALNLTVRRHRGLNDGLAEKYKGRRS